MNNDDLGVNHLLCWARARAKGEGRCVEGEKSDRNFLPFLFGW